MLSASASKRGVRDAACLAGVQKGDTFLCWLERAVPPATIPRLQACDEHYNLPPGASLPPGEEGAGAAAAAAGDRALLEAGGAAQAGDAVAEAVVEGTEDGTGEREVPDPDRDTGAHAAAAFDPEVHARYLALPPWPEATEDELTVRGVVLRPLRLASPALCATCTWRCSREAGQAGAAPPRPTTGADAVVAGRAPGLTLTCATPCPSLAPGLLEADRGCLRLRRQPPLGASAEPREAASGACPPATPPPPSRSALVHPRRCRAGWTQRSWWQAGPSRGKLEAGWARRLRSAPRPLPLCTHSPRSPHADAAPAAPCPCDCLPGRRCCCPPSCPPRRWIT